MTSRSVLRKFAGYVATGGTAAVVDLGGFVVLDRLGMPVVPAAGLSFTVAAGVNFWLSARFVFGVETGWIRFGLFLLMATAGFLVNVSATAIGVLFLELDPALAKLGGIAIAFGFNFAINLLWVFAGTGSETARSSEPRTGAEPHGGPQSRAADRAAASR